MLSPLVDRYRLCYIGGDGQDEIEFVFFDRMGKEILGKSLISILRAGHSSNTPLEDIVNSMRGDGSIPKELAAVVSTKYRFVVQVTSKSFESESSKPSYQVHRIDTDFGKQTHSSALRHKPALGIASSSKSPLMLGSSAGGTSASTLDAPRASHDSGDTNVSYELSLSYGYVSIYMYFLFKFYIIHISLLVADITLLHQSAKIPIGELTPTSVNKLPNLRYLQQLLYFITMF